jgi:hypothetical protein
MVRAAFSSDTCTGPGMIDSLYEVCPGCRESCFRDRWFAELLDRSVQNDRIRYLKSKNAFTSMKLPAWSL